MAVDAWQAHCRLHDGGSRHSRHRGCGAQRLEKVAIMPHSIFVGAHASKYYNNPSLPQNVRQKEKEFLFCSMNQLFKMDLELLAVWANVLRRGSTASSKASLLMLRHPEAAQSSVQSAASSLGMGLRLRDFLVLRQSKNTSHRWHVQTSFSTPRRTTLARQVSMHYGRASPSSPWLERKWSSEWAQAMPSVATLILLSPSPPRATKTWRCS